jgi:4-hydroxy-tetrahydrodipicolinate synthase
MGPEELLVQAMEIGAHGGVCGGSNVFPELFVKLYEAARDGRSSEAARLHDLVLEFGAVYRAGDNYLRGLKCALSLAGICCDVMAEPFQPLDANARAAVRRTLAQLSDISDQLSAGVSVRGCRTPSPQNEANRSASRLQTRNTQAES